MKYVLLLGIGIILYCCAGCVATQDKGDKIRVSLLRGPSVIALAQWIENPPTINGKEVEIEIVDSPEQIQALLVKGATDIAALPMISAANLYNKGIPYSLAGCPIWGTLYIIGKPDASQLHIFGTGTTPDIITRHYLNRQDKKWTTNYTLNTPLEIAQGLLSVKVEAAVLAEPFVSQILARDTSIHILADLNKIGKQSDGFPQTALMIASRLETERKQIDSLLFTASDYTQTHPKEIIEILQKQNLFPAGIITPASIERCKIEYKTAAESSDEIRSYLRLIYDYEPLSTGNKLPDNNFYQ